MKRNSNCETKRGTALTFIFSGTTHIHIPIVSGSMCRPNGNTSPWSKALLRMYDFPLRQGPAIDTTQTGPSRRSRNQKPKFHYNDPVTDIIRKQLKLRTKGKTQTHLTQTQYAPQVVFIWFGLNQAICELSKVI